MRMEDLKPCPFCGEEMGELAGTGWVYVICRQCDARGPDMRRAEKAIKLWNTRAPAPILDESEV